MAKEKSETNQGSISKITCWYAGTSCFLCTAFLLLSSILLLSILFVVLDVPHGFQSVSLRSLIIDVYWAALVPVIAFVAEILKSLFPWPVLAILVLGLLVWGPERIREFVLSLNFELPGLVKVVGGKTASDAFKKELGDAQRRGAQADKEINEAYESARVYLSQLRERYEIDKLASDLSVQVAGIIGKSCPDDYRFTLYVPDLVLEGRLYQLVEYYNKEGRRITDNRAGRTFSIRYGIIGRVWRSGVPEVEGELISPSDRHQLGPTPTITELEQFIARRWGLTMDEVIRIKDYQSYGSIRIERANKPLGVIFFDSKRKNAFGDKSELQKRVQVLVLESQLILGLLELNREIASWHRIQIVGSF